MADKTWSQMADEAYTKGKQYSILSDLDNALNNIQAFGQNVSLTVSDNMGNSVGYTLTGADAEDLRGFLLGQLLREYEQKRREFFPPATYAPEARIYVSGEELAKSIPGYLQQALVDGGSPEQKSSEEVALYRNPGAAFRAAAAALEKEPDAQTNPKTLTKIAELLLKAAEAEGKYGRSA